MSGMTVQREEYGGVRRQKLYWKEAGSAVFLPRLHFLLTMRPPVT
jgi:hypothetical protein